MVDLLQQPELTTAQTPRARNVNPIGDKGTVKGVFEAVVGLPFRIALLCIEVADYGQRVH